MSIAPFYIYRHIRPDKNEVFYIGKGNNLDKNKCLYYRAGQKARKNNIWKGIVKKNGGKYDIEILYECETEQGINKKEVEFIKLYGRIDLGIGTLANLTDGGDGCVGVRHSMATRKKMGDSRMGEKNYLSKKVIDVNTKKVYVNIPELSKRCGIGKWWLYKLISGDRVNYTPYVFYDDYINNGVDWALANSNMPKKKVILSNWEKLINTITGEVYDNKREAAKAVGLTTATLLRQLRGYYYSRGKRYNCINTSNLVYYNG